ncbi:MAG: transglutaminase family protein [Solirubrobacteraceae bacterium]
MSIRVAIEHRTVYRFDRPVQIGPQVVRLRPAPHCRTPILAYSLHAEPAEHFVKWQQDPFANHIARFNFPEPASTLAFQVDLIADLGVINPFDFFVEEYAERWPFEYPADLRRDLAAYMSTTPDDARSPRFDTWVKAADAQTAVNSTIDFLVELNRRVMGDVAYSERMDPGVLTPEQTLERGIGSCRDSAWLLVQALRAFGLAARFVSGYLVQLEDPDEPGSKPDFTDLHAWAEVYLPGAGWVGLDATSGLLAGEGHIPLACAGTPDATAPITGTTGEAETEFEYSNSVRRLDEPPGPTRPFTEAQWQRIDELGKAVDEALEEGDVRLTMGGEPTFVASAELDRPEWRIEALGGRKQELAARLATRLADRFASNPLITHPQGKWYPGEPIPRWQIGIHWRTDGRPMWRDPALLADPATPGEATDEQAGALIKALAAALGIPDSKPLAAYEDPVSEYWNEVRAPEAEIEPFQDEPGEPAGWVLPLAREAGEQRWRSDGWRLQRGALYLIPGDSPIGLRLPLDEVTWTPDEDAEPPARPALCTQTRNGRVHVFLPPVEDFVYAVELIVSLEDVAAALEQPIVVEGYPPPRDKRSNHFVVTPDPGVIEINIHPSESWPELVAQTLAIAEEATELGLGSDKFALDGRHDGTGGGSHITLGGTTPQDSPLLRRPALLRSMLTYWQHHPALSYAFSGKFIGPTSQAPRVDDARHEALYELEIAFGELERLSKDGPPPLWQVDRLLRHLLTDLTGNTHRAEFCIDKLYNPGSASGRLGVLELRGFEMAPHPRMQLLQALLVRALVARLWQRPYTGELVRWGAELHDRFMLPWWIERDLESIVLDLNSGGFEFELEWFTPFLEFRFPRLGTVAVEGVTLELREAIEPWHVLGEEQAEGGTARYVDSSIQRLQVRVDGMIGDRYLVACNGHVVPLVPTEIDGTAVAGVRYRAWSPWSALHPTIGVQAPLTFDLVDRWSERSLGGCRYHVTDPGGRAYDRVPVNAGEAEARRRSRFQAVHHSAGPLTAIDVRRSKEYPRTLDLRRAGFRR